MMRFRCLSGLILAIAVSAATPAFGDTYLAYSQGGLPLGADIWTWCDAGQPCDMLNVDVCGTPEGPTSLRTNTNIWAGWGVFHNIDEFDVAQPEDLSAYENGELRFWVKTPDSGLGPFNVKVEIQCRPDVTNVTYTKFIADYGWDGTDNWQEIVIPIADFFAPDPVDLTCLSTVLSPFMITIENLPFFNTFNADFARWETASSHSGASSVQVQGRQLLVDGKPFVVDAVAYSPVGIGENWANAWEDRPDRYTVDFPLMADAGANAVRLYAPILTTAMLDAAWAEGLFVIPTYGVDSIQLECAQGKSYMQDRFVEMVEQWKDHPAILFWLVGNEVNVNLGNADLCLDWYPQLDAMALAAHTAEGAAFHPVGTAAADMDDICIAGCSDDTSLPNVDLWGTQLYRGCTFGGALNEYGAKTDCARPLLVTEFGSDAFNRPGGAPGVEDQLMQANCLESLLAEGHQELAVRSPSGVLTGQVIFEWADEWWKAECEPTTSWLTQDTCASFVNPAYPDPNIHEEWWGIVTLDEADPAVRGTRMAHTSMGDEWLGAVCNMRVQTHNPATGDITISFDPARGNALDHNLHYGPLADVSTYGYSGSVPGLGATGSSSLTLPAGSLFWVLAAENGNIEEGCYGTDSAGTERPCFSGSCVSGWNCWNSAP